MNNISLIGNLVEDPTIRYTDEMSGICIFRVAVKRNYAKEGKQDTDFIKVTTFRNIENHGKYLKKGSKVGIVGELNIDVYDSDDGRKYFTKVKANHIEYLSPREKVAAGNKKPSQQDAIDQFKDFGKSIEIQDDDLPF